MLLVTSNVHLILLCGTTRRKQKCLFHKIKFVIIALFNVAASHFHTHIPKTTTTHGSQIMTWSHQVGLVVPIRDGEEGYSKTKVTSEEQHPNADTTRKTLTGCPRMPGNSKLELTARLHVIRTSISFLYASHRLGFILATLTKRHLVSKRHFKLEQKEEKKQQTTQLALIRYRTARCRKSKMGFVFSQCYVLSLALDHCH